MVKNLELRIADNPPELQVAAQAFHAAIYALEDAINLKAFNYIEQQSISTQAPYHNLYHTQCVAYYAFFGANASELDGWETTNLVLAALFHDFNHSAGQKPDTENIRQAVAGWRTFAQINQLSESRIGEVERLIQCTEYPFLAEPQTLPEKILRDADLLQITCPQWEEMIYEGLARELSITKMKPGQTFEAFKQEFAKGYRDFWLKAEFHSDWGKALRTANEEVIQERLNRFK